MARSWLAPLRHLGFLLVAFPAVAQWGNAASADLSAGASCEDTEIACGLGCCDANTQVCCGNLCQDKNDGGFCCGANQNAKWCLDSGAYCRDGQCCDAPCTGTCQGCSAAVKGQGSDGVCGNIKSGTDPRNECPDDGTDCGRDGWCGGGSCRFAPPGASCGATTCSGGTITGVTCNGSGTCQPGTVTNCAPYFCANGQSCASSCSSNTNCAPNYYCASDLTCQHVQTIGSPCGAATECQSGNCVDGFCCDSPCTGLCQACSASLKGTGASGTCGNIANNTDPNNECAFSDPLTCGQDGMCNGSGVCRKHVVGTGCGSTSCMNGQQNGNSCDGFGTCVLINATLCTPYVCNGTSCGTSCTADNQCVGASFCQVSNHTCQPDQTIGAQCSSASQCQSGKCVDGVCCDQVCSGLCQACSAALKGSGVDGVCASIKSGFDPQNECTDAGETSCAQDGLCNGTGACELYRSGTPCGSNTCVNGTQSGYSCNGLGTCNAATTAMCSPFVCGNTGTCNTSCTNDAGCVSTSYCRTTDGSCQPDQARGAQCTLATQCASGNCVDGFCCDGPCTGSCQSCAAASKASGANGTCGPIRVDTDPDNECPADPATGCQRNGLCDGIGACKLYPSGAPCGTTSCTSGTQTGYACNGSGVCLASAMTACSPYVCQSGSCGASCGSDVDCVAGAFCDASSHCVTDKGNGAACTSASQCVNGKCVDGVCCDQVCTGACRACSAAKKGGGADGVCDTVANDSDPDNDCAVDAPATCQKTGNCNGMGACALYKSGTSCGASQCSGSTLTGQQCNGLGMCAAGGTASCAPYQCLASNCPDTCGDDNGCVPTSYCAGAKCEAKKALGVSCSSAHECTNGFCVEGICCDSACNGLCQACQAANKGSGANGTCGNAKVGTDAHNDCPDDGPLSCKRDGMCDGTRTCRLYASGGACGPTQCVGNDQTGYACNGGGVCESNTTTPCKLQACSSGACTPACVNDADCAAVAYCDTASGMCVEKHKNGTACDVPSTCSSGICVDGVCCDQACGGQCQACDVATSMGTCSPVVGPAHGGRDKCLAASGNDPCSARACDGAKSIGSCVGYVGSEVGCRDESCKDGVETFSATCDGVGQCGPAGPAKTKVCQPYVCKGTACGAAPCSLETDCAPAFRCDATKKDCVPKNTATCDGNFTVTAANGKDKNDCSPYRCEASGVCRKECISVDDCVEGFACSAEKLCVLPDSSDGNAGACDCHLGRSEPSGQRSILAGVVALAICFRRGRRRRVHS